MQRPEGDEDIEMMEMGFNRDRDSSKADYHNFVEQDEPLLVGIENLDRFLANVYNYFLGKGFWPILLNTICNLLQFAFMVGFATFLVSFVDYHKLLQTKDWSQGIVWDIHRIHPFLWIVLVMAGLFWWVFFVGKFYQLKEYWHIKSFYEDVLHISQRELEYIGWPAIVTKLTKVPRLCRVKETWTPLDITQRLMRKDNFIIALFNKKVLDLRFPIVDRVIFPYLVEWSIKKVIFTRVFDSNLRVRREIMDPETVPGSPAFDRLVRDVRYQFKLLGAIMLLCSPFAFIYLALYAFFRYGEEVRNRPSFLSTRHWSKYAQWNFREFNELHHDFSTRLNLSHKHAQEYIDQFPHQYLFIFSKFFAFIVGSFVAVILIIAIFNDNILQLSVAGKSMIWCLGLFGAILAISRSVAPKEHAVFLPEKSMQKVYKYTHYMPKSWRGRANTPEVYDEFETLFEYRVFGFLVEIFSVFYTPILLLFVLPKSAENILVFFRKFTKHVDGVGHVCAFADFDIETFGNPKYGAAVEQQHKELQSKQGKMEKSFLSFKSKYKKWEPSNGGKKMLVNIASAATQESIRINQSGGIPISASSSPITPFATSTLLHSNNLTSQYQSIDDIVEHLDYDDLQKLQETFYVSNHRVPV